MSALTEALNRIINWLQKYRHSDVSFLQPGLSIAEIEEIVKAQHIQLPKEICELYQWRNGTRRGSTPWEYAAIFDYWGFKPLQQVIYPYYRSNNAACFPLYIFFRYHEAYETTDEGYVFIDNKQEFCPVFLESWRAGDRESVQKYASLTDMMLTIAECYEKAYSVDAKGYLIQDVDKSLQIWRKYNAYQISQAALARLNQELSIELLMEVEADLILAKNLGAVEPLIQVLQKPIVSDSDLAIQELAVKVLGELDDIRAVKLKSEFDSSRLN